ncbi:MAG: hypothetical protein AAGF84_14590 [Planctomycetota bacterium]
MSSGATNAIIFYVTETGINKFQADDVWFDAILESDRRGELISRIGMLGFCVTALVVLLIKFWPSRRVEKD